MENLDDVDRMIAHQCRNDACDPVCMYPVSPTREVIIGAEENARLGLASEPKGVQDVVISAYPEHEKMASMRAELDAIASFLEMVEAGEIKIHGNLDQLRFAYNAHDGYNRHGEEKTIFVPVNPSIEYCLAQWSGIDQNKLEAEKRAMLEAQRRMDDNR